MPAYRSWHPRPISAAGGCLLSLTPHSTERDFPFADGRVSKRGYAHRGAQVNMDFRIRRVVEILSSDLRVEVSFKDLAKSMNLSTSRLRHLFKAELGISPKQYVRKLKLQNARSLLEQTNYSIKEIGARVGLHDESHFVRDFESTFGQTPSRYRETFKERQMVAEVIRKNNMAEVLMTFALYSHSYRVSRGIDTRPHSGKIVPPAKRHKAERAS